jgi:hypothetical protein
VIDVRASFEAELQRRNLPFTIDSDSGRHAISIGGGNMLVSLENLEREVATGGDAGRIARFIDSIEASAALDRDTIDTTRLYWCLEPSDHFDKPEIRSELSDEVDRVLCHWSREAGLITWMSIEKLGGAGLDRESAGKLGFENLSRALSAASISSDEIDGVRLGMIASELPFKSSLILAPNARMILEPILGWPLFAVAPDRDFLYLWNAKHEEFTGRVGGVVVREYEGAAYPVSTEVWRIDDAGVQAIGAFPRKPK